VGTASLPLQEYVFVLQPNIDSDALPRHVAATEARSACVGWSRTNTFYDVLGVPRDASPETIRMAFRNAVKACHPDLHAGDPTTEEQFRELIAAYEWLKKPRQRALYDEYLARNERYSSSILRGRPVRTVVGVVSASVVASAVAVIVWLSLPTSQEPSGPPQAPHVTAGPVSQPVDRQAAAIADGGIGHNGDGGQATDRAVAALDSRAPDDPPRQLQQSAGHTEPQAPLANGWDSQEDRTVVSESSGRANNTAASNAPALYLARGELWARAGDLDQAIADFDEAIRLEPGKALAYSHRGNAWSRKGEKDRALADYDAAIRIDPNSPALFRDRGILWRRYGDLDRALLDFDHAIRLGFSDASAYNERGLVWYEKKSLDRAIADFNQALKINPNLVDALINRGSALRSKGDLDRAVADFEEAIRIDSNAAAALRNRTLVRSDKDGLGPATNDNAKERELPSSGAAHLAAPHVP
jgi:tetratricopeptide (TPR) repeat protein